MITLKNISLQRGTRLLFKDVNWTIYPKQRIGIIGQNGTGKSSLFSLLLKELEADQGTLEVPERLQIAHVAQETPGIDQSALQYVLEGDDELKNINLALKEAEKTNDGERIAHLHHKLLEIDGYSAPARAAKLLVGLGFNQQEQQQKVSEFSGGFRVRLNLARALIARSDVLLLDEPTNHLDLDAVIWLEKWILNYPGTLLLISHDRDFLDHVVNHIIHISHQQIKLYSGNYSTFERNRAEQLQLQQHAYEKQQKHIAHLNKFINRFRAKASKARQAQSRIKALERMTLISAVQTESPFQFQFKLPKVCPNPLIQLEEAEINYGDRIILKHLNLTINASDRIGFLGPNGAGKSSLIKLLAGELNSDPKARQISPKVNIGYFAQHQIDHLHMDHTPLQHLKLLDETLKDEPLRTYLGSFGFSSTRVNEKIKNFSGGEKSRLALALIIFQKPNLLLLDEPTNHLDLEMRQALILALQDYQGAMILVSHDRFLLRSTVDQFMLVANQKLSVYDGDLNDYEAWLLDYRRSEVFPAKIVEQNSILPKNRGLLVKQIKKIELDIQKIQSKLNHISDCLADNAMYAPENKTILQQELEKETQLKTELQNLELAWIEAHHALDATSK